MYNLTRNVSLISLFAVMAAVAATSLMYRFIVVADSTAQERRTQLMISRELANALSANLHRQRQARQVRDGVLKSALDEVSLRRLLADTQFIEIKILDRKGTILFAREPALIGTRADDIPDTILSGKELWVSHMSRDAELDEPAGRFAHRKILSTYLPISLDNDGTIDGVIETYSDMTPRFLEIRNSQLKFALAVLMIGCVFYIALYLVVRRADLILKKQARDKEEHLQLIESINKKLTEAHRQALQASEAKSVFLANMSHEIRTPLTAILGFADILSHRQVSECDREEAVRSISECGRHLLRIINDILDLSKIEADKLELKPSRISLFSLIDSVMSLVNVLAQEKGLKLEARFEFPVPEWIESDPFVVKQILVNLCNNAIKFTDQGSVELLTSYRQEENRIVFAVRDTGDGIDRAHLAMIFDPFCQVDNSDTRRHGGSGLGLAISRRMARLLGGDIAVTSTVAAGSCFTVELDAGPAAGEHLVSRRPPAATNAPEAPAAQRSFRGAVLVAEDNPFNQRLLAMYLGNYGIDVTLAKNGGEAVSEALSGEYDLILMDVQMPVMDGLEATKLLRASGYRGAIAALTARSMEGDASVCLAAGCDDYLSKPIVQSDMIALFEKHLRVSRETRDRNPSAAYTEAVAGLSEQFVVELPEICERMRQSAISGDWPRVRADAHELKGAGGNLGFVELSAVAKDIELRTAANEAPDIGGLMAQLEDTVRDIMAGRNKA